MDHLSSNQCFLAETPRHRHYGPFVLAPMASSLQTISPRTNVFLPKHKGIVTTDYLSSHQCFLAVTMDHLSSNQCFLAVTMDHLSSHQCFLAVTMDHLSSHQWHRHYRQLVHEPMFSCPSTKASSLRTIYPRIIVILPKHQSTVTTNHLYAHHCFLAQAPRHRHYRPLVHAPMFSCPNTMASSL